MPMQAWSIENRAWCGAISYGPLRQERQRKSSNVDARSFYAGWDT